MFECRPGYLFRTTKRYYRPARCDDLSENATAREGLTGVTQTRGDRVDAGVEHSFKQLENTRQEFVANVSHELRTPLSLIKGFVETLLDGAKDDPAVETRLSEARHLDARRGPGGGLSKRDSHYHARRDANWGT